MTIDKGGVYGREGSGGVFIRSREEGRMCRAEMRDDKKSEK
jgi:hypothetical protein